MCKKLLMFAPTLTSVIITHTDSDTHNNPNDVPHSGKRLKYAFGKATNACLILLAISQQPSQRQNDQVHM